jgi:hypothetical protein
MIILINRYIRNTNQQKGVFDFYIKNIDYRPIAFVLHINFIELSKINRILRHLTEANRMKFEVFVA